MKKIALTFDDGPNTVVTPLILDLLEENSIKATFFLVGENINSDSVPVMKRAVSMGCELENHSYSHPAMTELSSEERLFQVNRTTELIEENTGVKVCYFRPPYIAVDESTIKDVKYPLICGVGCNDWDENVSIDSRIEQVLANAEDGQIILLHDSRNNIKTYEALKTIIPKLKNREFEFVTLTELFSSYGEVPKAGNGILYSKAERHDDHNRFSKMALINDISGFGRCSITVQLPIVSAMGIQGCVLPTAILSNHTGYESFVCDDYTEKMEAYIAEWEKLNLKFEGICTGFLGSVHQIDIVCDFLKKFKTEGTRVVVDPVMGDDGKLYSTYTTEMSIRLGELLPYADIVTPNLTEACVLSGIEYGEYHSEEKLLEIAEKIAGKGPDKIVITGISKGQFVSNFWYDNGEYGFAHGNKVGCRRAGTGDIFSALIAGYAVKGLQFRESVQKTADFVEKCMIKSNEYGLPAQDGVCFETVIRDIVL